MKKRFYLMFVLAFIFLLPLNVNAQSITIAKDGLESVGAEQVHIFADKLKLDNSNATVNSALPDKFIAGRNVNYTDSNGSFDTVTYNRDLDAYDSNVAMGTYNLSYSFFAQTRANYIAYAGSLTVGKNNIAGTVSITFKDAAVLDTGEICDVQMMISNIMIDVKEGKVPTKPVLIAYDGKTVIIGIEAANQEKRADELTPSEGTALPHLSGYPIGANYTVTFVVKKKNGSTVENKNMVVAFNDLDTYDNFTSHDEGGNNYVDANGKPYPYNETITFLSGIVDNVHLASNTKLLADNGADTKIYYNTGGTDTTGTTIDDTKASFTALAKSDGFKFKWTGSNCATGMDFIQSYKITTSTSGTYKNNGTITKTIDYALWKTNRSIVMKADSGYVIDKITIDGVKINYQELSLNNNKRTVTKDGVTYTFTENNGSVTYTFNTIKKDHKIDVSFTKGGYVIHYNPNGGTGHMDDTIGEFDKKDNLSKNTYTRDGYTFVGWKAYCDDGNGKLVEHKDSNGKVITFNDQDEFLNLYCENNREVTLFAQWINNPKTGTFISLACIFAILAGSIVVFSVYSKKKNSENNSL